MGAGARRAFPLAQLRQAVHHPAYNSLWRTPQAKHSISNSVSVEYLLRMTQQWGVTPPISVAGPTPRELEVTRTLVQELRKEGIYPSVEEDRLR